MAPETIAADVTVAQSPLTAAPTTPVKQRRVRLPKVSTQLARVLQRLEVIVRKAEAGEIQLSPSRLTDILLEQSRVATILYRETLSADRQRAVDARRAAKARRDVGDSPAQSVDEPDLSVFMEYHSGGKSLGT